MQKPPIKHNPAFLTNEELATAFVVRHDDLRFLVQVIRENTTDSNQHVLVIGPRGIGKTMLVQRVALEVRQDEELRHRWYPLIFAEESYEVATAGEFWLESLFHLSQQTGDPTWGRTYEDLKREPVEGRLADRALAQLMDFADSQRKRILLIVENLNLIIGEQMADDHAWKLRHTLMHEPRVMLMATATTRLDVPKNTQKAMFELFKSHVLRPLNDEECQLVWRSVAGQELGPRRIRAIRILTGGNPRLLAIISHFGARLSFAELMQEMTGLVDDKTDYFKSHLEALPPTERKVYVALADLWDPSTAREVGNASRLTVSLTSSLLKRLINRGAVCESPQKGRTKRYQVAERMYNIYYLMRRRGAPSDRVKAVVEFMVQFYEHAELVEVAKRLTQEACHLSRGNRQYHYYAFEGIVKTAPPELRSMILRGTPRDFLAAPDLSESLRQWLSDASVLTVCPCDHPKHSERKVCDLISKGMNAAREGRRAEAETAFLVAIGIDATHPEAWMMLGKVLSETPGRRSEAEQAFRKATELAPSDPCAWDSLGRFLSRDSSRRVEAERAFRKALESYPDCSCAWLGLAELTNMQPDRSQDVAEDYREAEEACVRRIQEYPDRGGSWRNLARIRHYYTRRFTEAESAYRKAIEIDQQDNWAWAHLGFLLHEQLKRYPEAEDAYRKAVQIDPKYDWAWAHLGSLLHRRLERYTEAEDAYRKAVEIDAKYDWAWAQLGSLLHERMDRFTEAEAAYRKAIEIDPKYDWAWAQLGSLLHRWLERYNEAEDAYRMAVEIAPQNDLAWTQLGFLLHEKLERYTQAEDAYRKAVDIAPQNDLAWAQLGSLLHKKLERYPEAEDAYRKAIEIDPKYVWAWAQLGSLLHEKLERYPEAEDAYRKAIEIDPKYVWAWVQLGSLLHERLERYPEAEDAYRKAIEIDPKCGWAWAQLGSLLHKRLERYPEAEDAYRRVVEIDPKNDWTWMRLGSLLHEQLKRYTDAEVAYRTASGLDPKHSCPRTQLVKLLLAGQKQPDRAFELAQQSLAAIPESARLLNGLAWTFFDSGPMRYLAHAEEWARKAVALERDPEYIHTLVLVLARTGKAAEALQYALKVLEDTRYVAANIDDMVILFAELVAADCAAEAFIALRDSKSATTLEPVAVALQMHMEKDVHVAPEIVEIAGDVLKRFQSRIRSRKESGQEVAIHEMGQETIK